MFMFSDMMKRKEDEEIEKINLYNLILEQDEQQKLKNKNEDFSLDNHYKIENKKKEELEKVFKEIKTKIKLNYKIFRDNYNDKPKILPEILYNIKKEKNKNVFKFIIYNEKNCSKLIEIEYTDSGYVLFVDKLDNKDLILLVEKEKDYELLVYRFEPGQKDAKKRYFLSQKIQETFNGFELEYKKKNSYYFNYEEKGELINYILYYIKGISRNRFFSISNYGLKMYSLNNEEKYELVLQKPYQKVDFIYEINKNQFILGSNITTVEGFGFCGNAYTYYYTVLLNKIELKNIDEIENDLKQKSDNFNNDIKNNNDLNNLKVKEKLKFSFVSQNMFKFNSSSRLVYDSGIDLSDFVILKNKYFIITLNRIILIFDLEKGKEIKKYKINFKGYYSKIDIKKWDCNENDEFILIVDNNVFLFKLIEDYSSIISLSILNYTYFPNLCVMKPKNAYNLIIKKLKKINGVNNKYYSYNNDSNDILFY